MSFPSPALPVPALATYQMSYQGLAFGGIEQAAVYHLQELPEGLGIPDYITGDVQRALDQGEYAGLDLSPGRNITIKQVVRGVSALALDTARQALAAVLGPQGATESPLYLQLPSGCFACMARPRKSPVILNGSSIIGIRQRSVGTEAATLFHATDPRWYLMPSKALTVGLPEPSAGLVPPVTPPVLIPASGVSTVEAVNEGPMDTKPVFVITGPCVNPKITCISQPGAPSIAFEQALNPGDTLTIDTDWQSVVLVSAGSTLGSSRRSTEKPGATWFGFLPGSNIVEFTSDDKSKVAGTLTVQWASAFLGL